MTKKTFVRAKLVKGAKWYVDYTVFRADSGEETRHRQDFFLNEIENLTQRELVGNHLVRCVEAFVGNESARIRRVSEPLLSFADGVGRALQVKMQSPRVNTTRGYEKHSGKLLEWAEINGFTDRPLVEFTKRYAHEFRDWFTSKRKYSGRTINNCITDLSAMWNEMIDRDMVATNPWKAIKSAREGEKNRRIFTPEERRIVASEIEKTDYWLFRALLLQFFCYIRPVEICRLKFKDFDLGKGIIKIGFAESKVWRTRFCTIPRSVMHYFTDGIFDKRPSNYYVLGVLRLPDGRYISEPSPRPMHDQRTYKRHRKILERLQERGDLHDITGLIWYSWKDTGISLHARRTSPLSTRDQAGHSDFDMTLTYYHKEEVNAEYAALPNDLF